MNDSALETRADRESLMAARGESVTPGCGGASTALSSSSAASAAGPMQAKSGKKKEAQKIDNDDNDEEKQRGFFGTIYDWFSTVNSHINNPGNDLKELRRLREMDEMQSMTLFDDTEELADDAVDDIPYENGTMTNINQDKVVDDWVVLDKDNLNSKDVKVINAVDEMKGKKLINEED